MRRRLENAHPWIALAVLVITYLSITLGTATVLGQTRFSRIDGTVALAFGGLVMTQMIVMARIYRRDTGHSVGERRFAR